MSIIAKVPNDNFPYKTCSEIVKVNDVYRKESLVSLPDKRVIYVKNVNTDLTIRNETVRASEHEKNHKISRIRFENCIIVIDGNYEFDHCSFIHSNIISRGFSKFNNCVLKFVEYCGDYPSFKNNKMYDCTINGVKEIESCHIDQCDFRYIHMVKNSILIQTSCNIYYLEKDNDFISCSRFGTDDNISEFRSQTNPTVYKSRQKKTVDSLCKYGNKIKDYDFTKLYDRFLFGYKRLHNNKIACLLIDTSETPIIQPKGFEARVKKAFVLWIYDTERRHYIRNGYSMHDRRFVYNQGEYVEVNDFDNRINKECAPGIHLFKRYEDAFHYRYF